MLATAAALVFGVARSAATGPAGSYTATVFSDGFESGSLSNWDGLLGNGAATVTAAAAHTGLYGLQFSNAAGQFQVAAKGLPQPLVDSSTSFGVRIAAGSGFQMVAQARDASSSAHMWDLAYDATQHGFYFYPYGATGSTEIFTGANSALAGAWTTVEIQYTATATGGARIFLNGQTQPSWGVTGDYTRTVNLQRLQLWDDGPNTTSFDDVVVATPASTAAAPAAPSNVVGIPGDGTVALSWAAPASTGGSPITGYRVTPYVGTTAQAPVLTNSAATSYTVSGLTNGTTYTFTIAAINAVGASVESPASAAVTPKPGYTSSVFSDGFESGSTSAWDGLLGNGAANVIAGAAHAGSFGLELSNATGQFQVLAKGLAQPLVDSSVSFWVRIAAGPGYQAVAQGRDGSSGVHLWDLAYDGTQHAFFFYPYSSTGSTEISTGANSAAAATWINVEIHYTATANGGAQIYLNGQTQASWGVSGNYTRSANFQRLQLWDDGANATDFDQVAVAAPAGAASLPGAPTGVAGSGGNGTASLTWTAPASNGGSPITGYRITPYVGATPQPTINTGSAATSYTVNSLTNGTTYTFTVAAINAAGVGLDSAASAGVTPLAAQTVPGAPSGLAGVGGDKSVTLSWTPPASTGGQPITSYRITPFVGTSAQTAINTGSSTTSYVVTGLTNGTAYTFTVAATNSLGTGAASAASAAVSPRTGYTNVLFADGFESGDLSGWNGAPGSGTTAVGTGAAHTGTYGLRMTNTSGQYDFAVKSLSAAQTDVSSSFWVRLTSGSGFQTLAQARDGSSGVIMWQLYYDWGRGGLVFYPFTDTASTEIFTGLGSITIGGWTQIEIQYTAANPGGARLYINGRTNPAWTTTGNYTRTANLQMLQLWNDSVGTTDFDDVRIASTPPVGATVAGAPTGVTAIKRDGGATVSWTPPVSNGGSPVSGYRITPHINGVAQTPSLDPYATSTYTVNGLTNGTAYTFTVAAVNGVGTSVESAASAAVTPSAATLPGVPTGVAGAVSDSAVVLTWTAPANDGGSPLTGYVITPHAGSTALASTAVGATSTTATVTGLSNGTPYTFTVAAVNAVGRGGDSVASAPVTPAPALAQYTNVVFSDGFESGDLSNWSGGSGTGAATPATAAARTGGFGLRITNLEGQYRFVVKALTSPVADGVVSFWIRPTAEPGVSTVAQARDGASSAHMWDLSYDQTHKGFIFYPYSSTGSKELFTGNNTAQPGVWVKVSIQYTATTNGAARIFLNGQTQPTWGVSGDYSRPTTLQRLQLWDDTEGSNDFDDVSIATLPPVGANPPSPPSEVNTAPLDSAALVSWTEPTADGGSPVTGYQVTPYANGVALAPILTGSTALSFKVAGLTNGTTYTFAVAALNAAGTGTQSVQSAAVTPQPAPPPGAPTGGSASFANQSANVSWTAPTSDGGSPITNYRVTPYVNGVAQTPVVTGSTATSYTVTGLTNGTTYTFTIAAANTSGFGAESGQTNAVTPQPPQTPDAPTGVTGAARDSAVALTWTASASNGGSAITGYSITPYIGTVAQTAVLTGSNATGFTVTGLTNGRTYTFTVAAINSVGTGAASAPSAAVTPAVPPANPIVLENRNAGTTAWQFDIDQKAENHEIEGYASATSVNKGSSINFMVSLSARAQYTMDIYRIGWYPTGTNPDGTSCAPSCGGRLMLHVGPLNGTTQAPCPQVATVNDVNFGLTECQWTPSYALSVPATWTSGNYIVKLQRLDGRHLESYMTFVVRDDASTAAVVYGLDTSTWEAYNFWGGSGNNNVGYDLYGRFNDITGDPTGGRAFTVSFDRPYQGECASDGAGCFFNWDYPLINWMESKGYDMTYVTSTDLESNPSLLAGHRVFVNTGHDEYYSDNMRSALTGAIGSGINMAFFSANDFYYRTTWSANGTGTALRREHSDKNALPGSTTFEWKLLTPSHPENEIGGVMLLGVATDRPFLISDASSWIYAGTGLKNYTGTGTTNVVTSGPSQNALPGIVGYEFDARASTTQSLSQYVGSEPAGTHTVGHSFVPAGDGNATNVWSDSTLYTAPSGAMVYAAGTIQWPWGLSDGYNDGYCGCFHQYTNAATQKVTQNILDRLSR